MSSFNKGGIVQNQLSRLLFMSFYGFLVLHIVISCREMATYSRETQKMKWSNEGQSRGLLQQTSNSSKSKHSQLEQIALIP